LDYLGEQRKIEFDGIGALRNRRAAVITEIQAVLKGRPLDHSDDKLVLVETVKDHSIEVSGSFTQNKKISEGAALFPDKERPHEFPGRDALGCSELPPDGLFLLQDEIG